MVMLGLPQALLAVCFAWASNVYASPHPQNDPSSTTASTSAATPVASTCGDLIRAANADLYGIVDATKVFDCWSTVYFIPAVATRLVKYWQDTLQFQSSLDYLKSPPSGYQKPAVDLLAGLQVIQNTIDSSGYATQYDFEADLQRLLYSANDNHVSLFAGVLSSFTFGNPWGLTALSLDGQALPKVYLTQDLYSNLTRNPTHTWQPSAVVSINGQDTVEFLSEFASLNSRGTLEPHADWNTLMDSPVLSVLLDLTIWEGEATFYPGDTISYTFENGSSLSDKWFGLYRDTGDTGPLETGGDFYNYFVLGLYPASYDHNMSTPSNITKFTPQPTNSFSDYSIAYPARPDVYQPNLTVDAYTTGYFRHDTSLAVLSIPSFHATGADIQAFSDTVQNFLTQSKAQGLTKVVIDLQQNKGGDILLAYNTFKQFFPTIEPFAASKRRAHDLANTIGSVITNDWNGLSQADKEASHAASDEWIATIRLNALTGQNFGSWEELFGPSFDGVGNFTTSERLDTKNYMFDYDGLGQVNPPAPLLSSGQVDPYAANDIIMLTDALCSSSCALFMEMMRNDAGVKTVVMGGRPEYGPMQAPSQSRAARKYDLSELDMDINNTAIINKNAILPNRNDQTVFIEYGGISLREQVRQNDPVPLSMKYEAADCRIFLTPNTFSNFTNLWQYAADAIWTDPTKCVQGSTGFASSRPATAPPASVPLGVTYDTNGIVTFGNQSVPSIPFKGPSGPLPDDYVTDSTTDRVDSAEFNDHDLGSDPTGGFESSDGEEGYVMKQNSGEHPNGGGPAKRKRQLKRRAILWAGDIAI